MTPHDQPDQDESLHQTHAARRMFLSGLYTHGKALRETGIREQTRALVLAVRGADNAYRYNPSTEYILQAGDTLGVLADRQQVQQLRTLSGDPTPTNVPQRTS